MGEGDESRLIAWHLAMKQVHSRLRDALQVAEESLHTGQGIPAPERDLLIYCQGFCVALSGHHQAEDRTFFPNLAASQPELKPVLASLQQDHSMIEHLLHGLRDALAMRVSAVDLLAHLEGVAAIMESHFRYEERELVSVLETLELDIDPSAAFGPL